MRDDVYNDYLIADQDYHNGLSSAFYNNFTPAVDHYPGMGYDLSTISNDQVISILTKECEKTGVPFRLIQPGINLGSRADLLDMLAKNIQETQETGIIFHGLLVIGQYRMTFILPPGWDPQKSYPLMLDSSYGLNAEMFWQRGMVMLDTISKLSAENGRGAIGIVFQEGVLASRSMSNKLYEDLNTIMRVAIPALGVNPDSIMALGGSRGAIFALYAASHPAIEFRVRFVYARNPANDIELVASLAGPTFPYLWYAQVWSVGDYASLTNNWRSPDGLTGEEAHAAVLTGTSDPSLLWNEFSLSGPVKINNLLDRGTEVFLNFSTHDSITPDYDKWLLWKAYSTFGIPIETRIEYLIGHNSNAPNERDIIFLVAKKLSNEIDGAVRVPLVNEGRVTPYILSESGSVAAPYVAAIATNTLPLALTLPIDTLGDDTTSYVVGLGVPGKMYRLTFFRDDGHLSIVEFQLDKNGTWLWNPGPNVTAGQYELVKIEEMSGWGQPFRTIQTLRSSLPMSGNAVVKIVHGVGIRQYGIDVTSMIIRELYGEDDEFHLYNGNVPVMGTNGVVEIIPLANSCKSIC
ncbi:MAG: hypothetical protein WCG84_00450 [Candidatus Moraniibacteriota bacterium]